MDINNEQLTAHVKELEAEAKHWKQHSYTQESSIATLEQRISYLEKERDELKAECEFYAALRNNYPNTELIDRARREGYELSENYILSGETGGSNWTLSEYLRDSDIKLRTYDEAIAAQKKSEEQHG